MKDALGEVVNDKVFVINKSSDWWSYSYLWFSSLYFQKQANIHIIYYVYFLFKKYVTNDNY